MPFTELNRAINAFCHLEEVGNGFRVAVKDNIAVKGMPLTCGSPKLKNLQSFYDAHAVALLRAAGAVIVGKTNMDEFGMGSHTIHSVHGPSRHPLDPLRSIGGSSGGSAAAVLAGMCSVALGSDTGGSVRLPASYGGLVGFKPSYGRISRHGLVTYASSLDCIGIIAKEVGEVKRTFAILRDNEFGDSSMRPRKSEPKWNGPLLRIGVIREFEAESLTPAMTQLKDSLVPVSLPSNLIADTLPAYYVCSMMEASSNLARYQHQPALFGSNVPFGSEVARRLQIAAKIPSSVYSDALHLRQQICSALEHLFTQCDFLLLPTATRPPPLLTDITSSDDATENVSFESIRQLTQSPEWACDRLTVLASLAGLPAISLPLHPRDHLNQFIGTQLIGPAQHDEELLDLAELLK